MRYLIALFLTVPLSGCGVVPAYTTVPIPADVPTGAVFDCAEETTATFRAESDFWPAGVRVRNESAGIFEMGEYATWNELGYRYRLDLEKGKARLSIRATSLYLKDLGARKAASRLGRGIEECVKAARKERARA